MSHSADYTGRWRIEYVSFKNNHHLTVRLPEAVGAPTSVHSDSFSNALTSLMIYLPQDFKILDATFAPAGSDDFVAAAKPVENSNQDTLGYDHTIESNIWEQAGEIKFHWKAPGPSTTNFSIFGFNVDALAILTSTKHKVPAASAGGVGGAHAQFANIPVCGANGVLATIRSYITYQYNSYWESH